MALNVCWCFVWTLFFTLALTQSEMGSAIVVQPSQSSVNARVGCKVSICCQDLGTSIEWSPFGQRDPIVNGTDGIIIVETSTPQNDSIYPLRTSKLIYPSIGEDDRGAVTCSIDRDDNTVTRTYLIFVDAAPIAVNVTNVDISSYAVTEQVTLSCGVFTCAQGVELEFFRGESSLGMGTLSNTAQSVYTVAVTVDENTPGEYGCRATAQTPVLNAMELFNITGTPLPAPTTSSPPVTSVGGTNTDGTGTRSSTPGTMATTTDSAAILSVRPTLLLLLLAVLYAVRP